MGITKAYTTRVGSQSVPTTRLTGRRSGQVVAGARKKNSVQRPVVPAVAGVVRQCHRSSCHQVNGLALTTVTKLDVDGCKRAQVCTGYRVDGKIHREMPSDLLALTKLRAGV